VTALINNTKQQPVIGRQSKNWQNLDSIIDLNACMPMLDSGQDTPHIFFNSSNMGQSSDGAYSGASYGLDADAINQIEATRVNPVDNAVADSGDAFIVSEDTLIKKTRQRVSGMLLRAVVLQVVIIAIWLLV
jgi:hypothetical protein